MCFYIKDLKDLNNFYDGIKRIKEKDSEGMFIFSADTTPNYMKKERSEAIELENDDDNFQELWKVIHQKTQITSRRWIDFYDFQVLYFLSLIQSIFIVWNKKYSK